MQVIEIFNYRDTGDGIKTSIQRESIVCALAKIIHSEYLSRVWNKIKDFKIVVCLSI